MKRLKEFYEAEHPETKQNVAGGNAKSKLSNNITSADSALAPSFAKTTAEKINKSERTIQEEVQVASRIPEKVQTLIKDSGAPESQKFIIFVGSSDISSPNASSGASGASLVVAP